MADTQGGGAKLGEAYVEVIARLDKLNAQMEGAKKKVKKDTDDMKQGFDKFESSVVHSARALFGLRGTIGTIIAIPLIGAAVAQTRKLADSIEEIGIKSRTIGLGAEEYQKLTYAARQADVSTEELNTALAFFSKGLGQARAGVGPLVETLSRIDPTLAKQIKTAKNLSEAIGIASDAINSLSDAHDRNAVTAALFGRGGSASVRLFGSGAKTIEEFGKAAERAGQILSAEDIAKGSELSDAFTEAAAAIDTAFKRSLIDLAPVIVQTITLITSLLGHMTGITAEAKRARVDAAQANIERLNNEVVGLEERLANANAATGIFSGAQRFLAKGTEQQISSRLNEIAALEARIRDLQVGKFSTEVVDSAPKKPGRRLQKTNDPKELAEAQQKLAAFREKFLQETERFGELAKVQQENELKGFQKMLDDRLISEAEYIEVRAQLAELTAKRMAEAFEKEFKHVITALQTVGSAVEDELGKWIETGKFNAQEMVKSMLVQFAKLQVNRAIIQPLFGGADVKGGGIFGSLLAGLTGSGGWGASVLHGGSAAAIRTTASPALWANAPRLHSGLMPDEFPAILQSGETVLPRGTAPGGDTNVEIYNATGEPARTERSQRGNEQVLKVFIGEVKQEMAKGGFDTTLRSRYGVGIPPKRR